MSTSTAMAAPPRDDEAAALREDLIAARRIGRWYLRRQREDPRWVRAQRRADLALAGEWVGLIAATYLLVYGPLPWLAKALLLLPWSIYSSLALDNVIHYSNHWPFFRREWGNAALRALGVLVLASPLEVRYHHWEHHRSSDPADDPQAALDAIRSRPGVWGWVAMARYLGIEMARSVWGFLPWSAMPDYLRELKRTRPAHFREIVATRWAAVAWLGVLLALRPAETAFLLLPATLLVAPLASFLMNLTDHAPSDLEHPFRQATYLEPLTRLERLLSFVNHHTAATHLTHHLFPQVHWCHLRRLQKRLRPLYERYGAPRSLVVDPLLLGDPTGLVRVLGRLKREPTVRELWPARVAGAPPDHPVPVAPLLAPEGP